MSVFKRLEEVTVQTVENDKKVENVEVEEVTYITKDIEGEKVSFALTDEEKEAIYEIVKRDILEDDLFAFIEEKSKENQGELFAILIADEIKKQSVLDKIEDAKERIVEQNLKAFMEYALSSSLPIIYGTKGEK